MLPTQGRDAPQTDTPYILPVNPRTAYRQPLLFGGQMIPPQHPLYDLIDSILMQPYRPKTAPPSPSGPGEMLRKMRSRSYDI